MKGEGDIKNKNAICDNSERPDLSVILMLLCYCAAATAQKEICRSVVIGGPVSCVRGRNGRKRR